MTINFKQFNLSPDMIRGLEKMGFESPTPVQQAAIGPMQAYKDLLVQAPTGTGKTCAFAIPAVEDIDTNNRNIQTIVLCPTRELALQTTSVIKNLCTYKQGVRVLAIYGGESITRQITALKKRPQIIVATPGRMIDHMNRRTIKLGCVKLVVIDEADRMLDMGFRDEMNMILEKAPQKRQTVLFSATVPNEIKTLAKKYQTNSEHLHVQAQFNDISRIEQFYTEVQQGAKRPALVRILKNKSFTQILVFVRTQHMADNLVQSLDKGGYKADVLHGGLRQRQRDDVMKRYRSGVVNILVATDVAARGIDVLNIDAVVNYDIPDDFDSYTHRIGRTGRAGRIGVAHTFIYSKERDKLRTIINEASAPILPTNDTSKIDNAIKQSKPRSKSGGYQKQGQGQYSRTRKKSYSSSKKRKPPVSA